MAGADCGSETGFATQQGIPQAAQLTVGVLQARDACAGANCARTNIPPNKMANNRFTISTSMLPMHWRLQIIFIPFPCFHDGLGLISGHFRIRPQRLARCSNSLPH
jgi:hypothetical protein